MNQHYKMCHNTQYKSECAALLWTLWKYTVPLWKHTVWYTFNSFSAIVTERGVLILNPLSDIVAQWKPAVVSFNIISTES